MGWEWNHTLYELFFFAFGVYWFEKSNNLLWFFKNAIWSLVSKNIGDNYSIKLLKSYSISDCNVELYDGSCNSFFDFLTSVFLLAVPCNSWTFYKSTLVSLYILRKQVYVCMAYRYKYTYINDTIFFKNLLGTFQIFASETSSSGIILQIKLSNVDVFLHGCILFSCLFNPI